MPEQKSRLRPVDELTFEQALAELERLANRMAVGQVTLRETVASYERGQALIQRCEAELRQARQTIENLKDYVSHS